MIDINRGTMASNKRMQLIVNEINELIRLEIALPHMDKNQNLMKINQGFTQWRRQNFSLKEV